MDHYPASSTPITQEPERVAIERGGAAFRDVVARIADIFPGGCKIHYDPPGYTIEDRARELCEEQEAREKEKYQRIMERKWKKGLIAS